MATAPRSNAEHAAALNTGILTRSLAAMPIEIRTESAVHEPSSVGAGIGHLDGKLDRAAHVHRSLRNFGTQRLSVQELEGQAGAVVMLTNVKQRRDVRGLQRDERPNLLHEKRPGFSVLDKPGRQ